MSLPPRRFNESDEQYLARLAAEGPLRGKGAIEIMATRSTGVGHITLAWAHVFPGGIVDVTSGLSGRMVMRLHPPPIEREPAFRLIERVAALCNRMS
jgi:hypothetical protein